MRKKKKARGPLTSRKLPEWNDAPAKINLTADGPLGRLVLLAEYAQKPPRRMYNVDCYVNDEEGGDVFLPDEDGDCIGAMWSWDLRNSNMSARISIRAGTKPADVVRLLRKAANWIKRDGICVDQYRDRGLSGEMGAPPTPPGESVF